MESRSKAKDLEIEEDPDAHNNPAIPHTFVREPGLKIYTEVTEHEP